MVPPRSDRISRVPPYSRIILRVTRTGLSPAKARHSRRFRLSLDYHWPGPRSLATTSGVSVDVLSSGYLDVSVPRVRLPHLWIQCRIPIAGWVSPFGNSRINACSRLPMTYRSVLRPSSPLSAKASTRCPSLALDTRHLPRNSREGAAFAAAHRGKTLLPANLSPRKWGMGGRPSRNLSLRKQRAGAHAYGGLT